LLLRLQKPVSVLCTHFFSAFFAEKLFFSETTFAAKKFDSLLGELGARRIGDPLFNDSCIGLPEDDAAEWIESWIPLCRKQLSLEASA